MSNLTQIREQLVTKEDLAEFKQDLLLSLLRMIQENAVKPAKKWLKTCEVKRILQVSNGTMLTLRANGTLPFTKIGNIIYYDAEEINKVLSDKKKIFPKYMIPPKKSN